MVDRGIQPVQVFGQRECMCGSGYGPPPRGLHRGPLPGTHPPSLPKYAAAVLLYLNGFSSQPHQKTAHPKGCAFILLRVPVGTRFAFLLRKNNCPARSSPRRRRSFRAAFKWVLVPAAPKDGTPQRVCRLLVRAWGLEPQRNAQEPKSCMSTNSIMPAGQRMIYAYFTMAMLPCQRQAGFSPM